MTDAEIFLTLLLTANSGILFLIWAILKLAARLKIQYELTNGYIETLLRMIEADLLHIKEKRQEMDRLKEAEIESRPVLQEIRDKK